MIGVLRFIGLATASVWVGTVMFYSLAIAPAMGSPEMLKILPDAYAGAVLQLLRDRYFDFNLFCGLLACLHLLGEALYTGRQLDRFQVYVLIALLSVGLLGNFVLQPKLQRLHVAAYGPNATAEVRKAASRSYRAWNVVYHIINLALVAGVFIHLWRTATAQSSYRILGSNQFRS